MAVALVHLRKGVAAVDDRQEAAGLGQPYQFVHVLRPLRDGPGNDLEVAGEVDPGRPQHLRQGCIHDQQRPPWVST